MTRPALFISGGTDALCGQVGTGLPDVDLIKRSPLSSNPATPVDIAGWVHFLPATATAGEELSLWEWAVTEALGALSKIPNASLVAVMPTPGIFADEAARAAVMAAAAVVADLRTVAAAVAPQGIRLNAIEYGPMHIASTLPARPDDVLRSRTPIGRIGSLGELLDAIRFLLSAEASYITGSVLRVDGGWNAYSWFYPVQDI